MVVDQSLVCYILDNNTGKIVSFNIEKPEGFSDRYSANFQTQEVRGRSSPFQSFINSGPRTIDFSVIVALDFRRSLAVHTDAIRKILKPYDNGSGIAVLPPSVHVKIGVALDIDAIPNSFSAEWSGGYKNGVYRLCTWSFSFTEVEEASTYNSSASLGGSIGELNSAIPAGLLSGGTGSSGTTTASIQSIEVGNIITLSKKVNGYTSSNSAANSATSGYTSVSPGDYTIMNKKGGAVQISNDGGATSVWVYSKI